jgi:apolipoprotein D and lipocalin family protein
MKLRAIASLLLLYLTGCVAVPNGLAPVERFDLNLYLGTWYEIARLDHSFERGLSRVTAEYSLREDGSVRVRNRGYAAASGAWKEATGRASFAGRTDQGYLKVSFFGPFYGAYVILDLDDSYHTALVCGPNRSYLWILARTPSIPVEVKDRLTAKAASFGFDTESLIFVDHSPPATGPHDSSYSPDVPHRRVANL